MEQQIPIIPFTSTDPTSHSYYFMDDVVNDREIQFLINSVEINEGRYINATIGGGGSNHGLDLDVRRSQVCWLDPSDESIKFFYTKILNAFKEINQNFFRYALTGIENTQFTKYTENDLSYYNWHEDEPSLGFKHQPSRKLSGVLFLSDPSDYEGGELQICKSPNDIITIEPKKGRMVFFPSYTIHTVNPVTKGVRYTAVNWARGPAFV